MSMHDTEWADVQKYIEDMRNNETLKNTNILPRRYFSALDNHNPIREYANGWAVQYSNRHIKNAFVLFHNGQFEKGSANQISKPIGFLIDDGYSVKPYYVASWNETGGFYILHPMTNVYTSTKPRKFYGLNLAPCDENGNTFYPSFP